MSSVSTLTVGKTAGPSPGHESRSISGMRYGIPLGWLFLFAEEDRVPYRPEEYPEDLFFYRAPREKACIRLREAVDLLSQDSYLGVRTASLRSLLGLLEKATEPWVEFCFEEIIFMGIQTKKHLDRLQRWPRVRVEILALARDRRFHAVRERMNSVSEGFSLHGYPWLDHLWWWFDRKFLRIATDKELIDWYISGGLDTEEGGSEATPPQ